MKNKKNLFCLNCRIIVAKKINVPPDDIDVEPILDCIERSLALKGYMNMKDIQNLVLVPNSKQEEEALCSYYGPFAIEFILELIFTSKQMLIDDEAMIDEAMTDETMTDEERKIIEEMDEDDEEFDW